MERMSPQDAFYLRVEDEANHMHSASVAVFAGPAPGYDETVEMVKSKLHLVPRYRRRIRFVPLELGRPVWVDDPHFNIEYHVRHTSLPRPGSDDQLCNLVGRVMSQQLDRAKPLWELWITEGLGEGQWAILSKIHHALGDGVPGTDLLSMIVEESPSPRGSKPETWKPEAQPSNAQLLGNAVLERVLSPYEQLRTLRALVRGPRRVARELREFGRGLLDLESEQPTPSLTGPIGPHRRWGWTTSTLEDVRKIRKAHGGTVNDVILALVTRGFRDLLRARGQPPIDTVVRTLVPVSVRAKSARGLHSNRVAPTFAELPVGIADPLQRLDVLHRQMEDLRERERAVPAESLTRLSRFASPALLSAGTRLVARSRQPALQTVTINVPGPQQTLYAAGRRMVAVHPYVPLLDCVRIGVAIFSYAGELSFGVTGDYESVPDIGVLCAGIEEGMDELLDLS